MKLSDVRRTHVELAYRAKDRVTAGVKIRHVSETERQKQRQRNRTRDEEKE